MKSNDQYISEHYDRHSHVLKSESKLCRQVSFVMSDSERRYIFEIC